MSPDKALRLDALTSQISETIMTVALCAQEIRSLVRAELDGDAQARPRPSGAQLVATCRHQRPLLDESTLSVIWKGRTLRLGHTVSFRLLARLARRPNQFVTHLDLLRDVWDDEDVATATIRSVVRHLRRRLREGGMKELAIAIRGHNGRYILEL